jgi:hypothetical protein
MIIKKVGGCAMYNSKEKAIREEARTAIIKALQDGYTGYYWALSAEVFNTDYFNDDIYQAKEALEEYGVWDAIAKVQAYEKNNYGGIYTDLSDPEQLIVMLYGIIGEEVLLEMMDGIKVWDESQNSQANEAANAEILKAMKGVIS